MSSNRPNILVLYTDQQALWTISAYSGKTAIAQDIQTPNIDRLAREGAILNNYFTNSSACTPSRGCFVSGLYPHEHNAYKNNQRMGSLTAQGGTWGARLVDLEYETGWIGKWHLDGPMKPGKGSTRPHGFEHKKWRWNRGHYKKVIGKGKGMAMEIDEFKYGAPKDIENEHEYATNWLTGRTIDFIENHVKKGSNKPFAWVVSYPDPHNPFHSYGKYENEFDPNTVSIPDSYSTTSYRPNWAKENNIARHDLMNFKAGYLGLVRCIDDNVGRILDTLDDLGISNNTIVIFTTDHGELMGEHGLMGKNKMYEPSFHIPFIIRWPDLIAPGNVVEEFVTTVDVRRTILRLAGSRETLNDSGRDASRLFLPEWADANGKVVV